MITILKNSTSLYSYNSKDLQHWAEKQVYISLGNILLGLAALEINATPIEGIEPHIINTEFNLAEKGLKTSVIVTTGYSYEDDFNAKLPKSRLPEEKIFTRI